MRQFAPPAEARLEILTADDLQRLDEAALHVLATIGVAVPAPAAQPRSNTGLVSTKYRWSALLTSPSSSNTCPAATSAGLIAS